MKSNFIGFSIFFISIVLTGCASSGPELRYNDDYSSTKNIIEVKSKLDLESDQRLAVLLKESAKLLNARGYEYFKIHQTTGILGKRKNGISPFVTDFESLLNYCYPKQYGLENKCIGYDRGYSYLKVIGIKKNLLIPTWSVQQVLSDKKIVDLTKNIKNEAVFVKMLQMEK